MRFGLSSVLATVLTTVILAGTVQAATQLNVNTLNKKLQETHAGWVAKETAVGSLSAAEARRMMGYNRQGVQGVEFTNVSSYTRANLPTALDWRDKGGINWISPILNQANCGSCVAFASIGVLESMVNIATGIPNINVHLSAQNLFSCGGGMCDYGWVPESAASFIQSTGVPDEACMPYVAGATGEDVACSASCADTATRVVKIASFNAPTRMVRDVEAVKQALQNGPVVTTLSVYADFMNYASGVYKHVSGSVLGGHAISIVGYDDAKQAFIVRNSWGHEWGQDGFGYVAYDDVSGVGEETWSYQMPAVSGAVALLQPSDYSYSTGHIAIKASSTFAGTASMLASVLNGNESIASKSCASPCEADLDVAAIPDGRYDLQTTAFDASGKVLGTSVRRMIYIANTSPKISVTFKGKDVDLTQPLKARVVFTINTTTSSVPMSSLQFNFKGADGVVHTKAANIVLSEMTLGWRTNLVANGTYEIWMTGHVDTNGFQNQVESQHLTVTTSN